jgi:cell division protein FtsW (lipid II flippase)
MRSQLVAGVLLILLAIGYWFAADAIPKSPLSGGVGADGLPKLLAVSLGVLSLGLVLQSLAYLRSQRRGGIVAAHTDEVDWRGHAKALGLIVIGLAYYFALPHLGYAVTVALTLMVVAAYSGLRPSLKMGIFGVIGAVAFYLIFARILGVPVPAGVWSQLLV